MPNVVGNLIVSAVSTFDNKGLKKGTKEISAFDKKIRTLGKAFAAVGVGAFAKSAVNAFIESEKAAAKLNTTVKNLGLQFEQPAINKYLQSLSLQYGIIDENLIPGFQRLLLTTQDVAKTQKIFETALNVSAGTGKDLTTVSVALSKAYLGDNAALGRLGVGLSKAQLKSADFLDIQRQLNINFAGQAAAAVQGYAGDMAKLTVAVDQSKEAIGKGLLDALAALSNSQDINTFTVKMVNAAEKIGNAFAKLGDFIGLLNPNAAVKVGGEFVRRSNPNAARLSPATSRANLLRAQEVKSTKELVSLKKQEITTLKEKSAVDKLRDQFDIERIGYTKALNEATDAETKLRLQAKIAILDNNEALAKKILEELAAANAAKKLAEDALAAAKALAALGTFDPSRFRRGEEASMAGLAAAMAALAGLGGGGGGANDGITGTLGGSVFDPSFFRRGEERSMAGLEITVNTQGTGDKFAALIAESLQIAQKSGVSYGIAGGL